MHTLSVVNRLISVFDVFISINDYALMVNIIKAVTVHLTVKIS